MEQLTRGQIACIHAMLFKLAMQSKKEDLVAGFSGGRTEHVSELHKEEAIAMIKHLKSLDPEELGAEKMRKRIISMAHECGYRFPGTTRVDMARLDQWCVTYGYLHKKLNQYQYKELPKLVTQFEGVYKSYLNKV